MTTPSNSRPAALAFIFVTMLIDVLGFGLVIPVMPRLVATLAHTDLSHAAHIYGWLLSCFGLMQFLFSPLLGGLSDRFGRRPVLLLSLFFNGVDYVISAVAPTVGWMFVGRILAGVTAASFTVATAYIADTSDPEKRAQNFGLIGAAFGLGFILGPAVGGLLGRISVRAPFWAAAGLSLVNCLYGAFVVPESLPPDKRRAVKASELNPARGLAILGRYPWVVALAASMILLNLAQQCLQSVWVLYTTYRYRWTPVDTGLSLALIGLLIAVVQVGLTRVLVPRLGERRAVVVGMLFNVAGFLGFALATRGWMMIPVIVVWCVSGITGPSIQSLLSHQYPSNEQGGVQGALTSLSSLTGIVGPLIGTWVFGYFTSAAAPIALPGAPFFLGAAFIVASAFVATVAMRRHKAAAA